MKTGIIFGAWDLLHPGHVFTLKKAKEQCDELIVGFHINPQEERPAKNKPIESVFERWLRLKGCRYIDGIIPYETEAEIYTILELVEPQVRFLGTDYVGKDFTAKEMPIPTIFLPRNHSYSSTNLRKRLNA